MKNFTLTHPADVGGAITAGAQPESAFLAGGTTVIDLWKLGAFEFAQLVDLNQLQLRGIEASANGLKLGALERMNAVGENPAVKTHYPVVSEALLLSASPQIRNMGTMGGNLLQRPRSLTYRNPDPNRHDGPSRFDAIFGITKQSSAPHPSDLAVALTALDASVRIQGKGTTGTPERVMKLSEFYKVPQADLRFDTLAPGDLITSVEAQVPFARRSAYIKVRDRASYQFAVVSAAVVLDLDGDTIREARVAAGGVGTIPWRLPQIEAALKGKAASPETFQAAVADVGTGAVTHSHNQFKIELLKLTIIRALIAARSIV
ncbi:MAG TPA: xanthine dehydrogenase family protein subunit M [Candidatus Methylacidiphilales bacterium]|nr:xanthine dehydrogenase family protein subunit M [Candidatus Methylacidiphilales bacterium]